MVTYFNKRDLADFGRYLLSKERQDRISADYKKGDSVPLDDRLREVYHADIENWINNQKSKS